MNRTIPQLSPVVGNRRNHRSAAYADLADLGASLPMRVGLLTRTWIASIAHFPRNSCNFTLETMLELLTPFLGVVDRLIKLVELRDARSRRLFDDFVEPLFVEFEPLALDYQRFFGECRSLLAELQESHDPYTAARATARRIRSRREEFLLARRKATKLADALQKHIDDEDVRRFGALVASFFYGTDVKMKTSDSQRAADLFDLVAAWKLPLPAPKHVYPGGGPRMHALADFLMTTSANLTFQWTEIVDLYATIRAQRHGR